MIDSVKTAVKRVGDYRIGGYLVWFGNEELRDLYGEYFTPETNYYLKWFDRRPMLYQHGFDNTLETATIGYIDLVKMDATGVYAEGEIAPDDWLADQLELRKQYIDRIIYMVDEGKLAWSSGTLSHVALVSPDGKILRWPIVEGSLTPEPAEPRGTIIVPRFYSDINSTKARYKALKLDTSIFDDPPPKENPPIEAGADQSITLSQEPITQKESPMDLEKVVQGVLSKLMESGLTPEQLTQIQNALMEGLAGMAASPEVAADPMALYTEAFSRAYQMADQIKRAQETESRLHDQRLNAAMETVRRNTPPPGSSGFSGLDLLNGGGNTRNRQTITDMQDMRFDHLKAEDLAFGVVILNAAKQAPSEDMLRATAYKAAQQAEKGKGVFASPAVRRAMPGVKVNEIVATNLTGFGTEWVGVAYETRLWEAVHETPMYQDMLAKGAMQLEIPQGVASIDIPTEGSDPVWSTMPELNDLETDERAPVRPVTTTPSTLKRPLAPAELGARIVYTDTMEEDALFPLLPFYRNAMERSAQETVEMVMFNGDTATGANTNINLIDGTPAVDAKGRGAAYLALNGMLKLAIITNTALSRDAGATFDESDFIATQQLLPAKHQIATDRLMFVIDAYVAAAAQNIAAFKTRDVFTRATLENGMLNTILGIDVRRTGFVERANALGRISATPGNNTRGRLMLVRPDQWAFGWKRRVRTEVARDIESTATIIVSSLRFGLVHRSTTSGIAVSYNVAIS